MVWVWIPSSVLEQDTGSGRVFLGSGISLQMVQDLELDCSQEVGFAKIGHGMQNSNMKKWDVGFS